MVLQAGRTPARWDKLAKGAVRSSSVQCLLSLFRLCPCVSPSLCLYGVKFSHSLLCFGSSAGDAGDEMGDASSSGDDELLISPDELKSIRSAVSDLVRRNRKAADLDADADDEDGASAAQSEALAAQISDLQTRMQQRLLKRLGKAVQKNHGEFSPDTFAHKSSSSPCVEPWQCFSN